MTTCRDASVSFDQERVRKTIHQLDTEMMGFCPAGPSWQINSFSSELNRLLVHNIILLAVRRHGFIERMTLNVFAVFSFKIEIAHWVSRARFDIIKMSYQCSLTE